MSLRARIERVARSQAERAEGMPKGDRSTSEFWGRLAVSRGWSYQGVLEDERRREAAGDGSGPLTAQEVAYETWSALREQEDPMPEELRSDVPTGGTA